MRAKRPSRPPLGWRLKTSVPDLSESLSGTNFASTNRSPCRVYPGETDKVIADLRLPKLPPFPRRWASAAVGSGWRVGLKR
jgi:hypothetical protein